MTLEDIINFLHDEAQEQTLTRTDIERCALLIHEMGVTAGRNTEFPPRSDKFGWSNAYLAEMGYGTWRMVLKREGWAVSEIADTLDDTHPKAQHAWHAAAAAIRRRVVNWRMPAEEETTR